MTNITERLRSIHIHQVGQGLPELCEEAARTIEKLRADLLLMKEAADYLGAGQTTSVKWEHDT
jgi:hypothetical protein